MSLLFINLYILFINTLHRTHHLMMIFLYIILLIFGLNYKPANVGSFQMSTKFWDKVSMLYLMTVDVLYFFSPRYLFSFSKWRLCVSGTHFNKWLFGRMNNNLLVMAPYTFESYWVWYEKEWRINNYCQ